MHARPAPPRPWGKWLPGPWKFLRLPRPVPPHPENAPRIWLPTLPRPTPKIFLLPRPEAKKRLPRASLTNMAENRVPKLWFRVQNGPKNANAKSPKIILMPLKCIELTARTCESFSSEMSSDLFPAPTVRRCASQRAPRSPNSNGEQVFRLTRSCHSLWSSSPSSSPSSAWEQKLIGSTITWTLSRLHL